MPTRLATRTAKACPTTMPTRLATRTAKACPTTMPTRLATRTASSVAYVRPLRNGRGAVLPGLGLGSARCCQRREGREEPTGPRTGQPPG
eukprot:scaffold20280_cov37-Phaeocystis_antarctica.AAC.1